MKLGNKEVRQLTGALYFKRQFQNTIEFLERVADKELLLLVALYLNIGQCAFVSRFEMYL